MNETVKDALLEALKLYEASVKRMQNAKPKFAKVYTSELTAIAEARSFVMANAKKA